MEWTDIQITVPQQYAETAEAIATMVSNGGIYIEDYRDLEQQAWEIAHVDLIEQDLLDQPRDIVKVHMYLAPDENPAEILPLFKERLEASGVEYKLETSGIEQEDWQNAWKKYYHAMDIGQRLAIVPGWETYDTDRIVITMDPGMAFGTGTHETTSLCLETLDGLGYVGWINGERVMIGSRRLMDTYDIQLPSMEYERRHTVNQRRVIYLAVSGKLFSMFQVAYQSDPDTAAVLDSLRRAGLSLIVDCDDFNCDEALLQTAYNLPVGTVKVLSGKEHKALEPAVAWLPESEGSMLHLGSFASFVGGLEAAAGAAEGEHRSSMVLSASVLISCILAMIMALAGGLAGLPLPALALYQVAWAVLAMIFPLIQRY